MAPGKGARTSQDKSRNFSEAFELDSLPKRNLSTAGREAPGKPFLKVPEKGLDF